MKKKTSLIWKIDTALLEEIVKKSDTISEILKYFGLQNKGGNYRTLKSRLEFDNIDFSHIKQGYNNNLGRKFEFLPKRSLEDILVENSTYRNGTSIKNRLFREGLLENKCYECGLQDFWNNKKIVLQLEHINGINTDNRIENLKILCPNCHSQTETFAGKSLTRKPKRIAISNMKKYYELDSKIKTRKINRPSYEILINQIKEIGYSATGRIYGVSDNAIRKWLINYEKYNTESSSGRINLFERLDTGSNPFSVV